MFYFFLFAISLKKSSFRFSFFASWSFSSLNKSSKSLFVWIDSLNPKKSWGGGLSFLIWFKFVDSFFFTFELSVDFSSSKLSRFPSIKFSTLPDIFSDFSFFPAFKLGIFCEFLNKNPSFFSFSTPFTFWFMFSCSSNLILLRLRQLLKSMFKGN